MDARDFVIILLINVLCLQILFFSFHMPVRKWIQQHEYPDKVQRRRNRFETCGAIFNQHLRVLKLSGAIAFE